MAIDWQTRSEGTLAHRYHRLTEAEARAAELPDSPGVYELEVGGETVYTLVLPSLAMRGRPLRYLPVVYATREDAIAHGDAWAARDRDVFWAEVDSGERSP